MLDLDIQLYDLAEMSVPGDREGSSGNTTLVWASIALAGLIIDKYYTQQFQIPLELSYVPKRYSFWIYYSSLGSLPWPKA